MKKILCGFLMAGSLLISLFAFALDQPNSATQVTRLADAYVKAYIARFPEHAAFAGTTLPHNDRFTDNTVAAYRAWEQREDRWLNELSKIDESALIGKPEWVTYGFLREALESARGVRVCRRELWTVNQINGWQATMPDYLGVLPLGTPERRQDLLRQWTTLPQFLENDLSNLKTGLAAGYSTPKHNVELVIAQLDGYLNVSVEKSPLYEPALRDPDPGFVASWKKLLTDSINPAIRKYRDFLSTTYLSKARTEIGVSANPNGAACYAASLRAQTGLTISPQGMYDNGKRAVEEQQATVKALAQKIYGTEDLSQLRSKLEADPENHFKTRDEVMAYSKAAVDRAWQALPRDFGLIPKAKVRIEPIAAFDEEHGVPHYVPASEDGSRPGTYYISLFEPEKQLKSRVEMVAFHETVPGHHLQGAIALELPKAHPITHLIWNGGFGEGWAVYSENKLALEMGLFSSDRNHLGELVQFPTGMVADPGIHAMGWSRQQTIDYFLATRPDYSAKLAESQTDRIVVTPGQLTTYWAGALEIMALREQAQNVLGDKFDVRAFHDEVLKDGSITLPMLREKIGRWLTTVSGK
ncbi:MAG: DUF885 domain-containing protein [Verrucomicrobiota bacterium]|nr:DUF885 domain-containing protein [Verrucomicrobiota bacterium]